MNAAQQNPLAWRHYLQAGDGALIVEHGNMVKRIAKVTRTTKTLVIIANDMGRQRRFSRIFGREVGVRKAAYIEPITDAAREQIQAVANRQELDALTYRRERLTDAEVGVMLSALKAYRAQQEPT